MSFVGSERGDQNRQNSSGIQHRGRRAGWRSDRVRRSVRGMDEHRPDPATENPRDDAAEETSDDDAPLGGDETTEEQLEADNEVEEDMLKSLDPENPA